MQPAQAFELGYLPAASGFFFDGMEVVAAASPAAGGLEPLSHAFTLVADDALATRDRMEALCALVGAAHSVAWPLPNGVDDYRLLLTNGVFDIVNRWSYIADAKQMGRLQAWFYLGFGIGRASSVLQALPLLMRLRDTIGTAEPVPSMCESLRSLLAEAIRQLELAAREADLDAVRPELMAVADALKPVAIRLLGSADTIASSLDDTERLGLLRALLERARNPGFAPILRS
jgi:hypothetical protein